jgi:PAS domain S-box-containing protein
MTDIGERKKAEERFRMAVEASPSGMVMLDQDRNIALVNSEAERLFGHKRREMLGKSVEMLMPERFWGQIGIVSKPRTLGAGRDLFCLRRDGTEVPVEVRLSPIRIEGKRFALVSILDITERKKAQEEIAEAARQQASLYQLVQRLQNAKSLHDVYIAALEGITSALHTDRASILLLDNKQVMRFVAWRGISATYRRAVVRHSPWKPGTKNPKPVCIADMRLADISTSLKRTMRREGIRAAAFIPLITEGNLIGEFMIYHHVPHAFTHSELDLAITVGRQVAQAIEHQKNEKALRQRERELARELLDQKQLQKISSQLIKQQQVEAVYMQIIEATMALLRSDCGSLQMVLPETDELLLLAQKGFAAGSADGWQRITRNGGTTCAEAFRSGERVIVPDLEQCHRVKKAELVSYRKSGIRSVQSTPLFSRAGELVGIISNHWRKVHEPSKRELRLLDVLARQAADLIEWKRADEEVRESEARMRATVEQATVGVARCNVKGRIIFVNRKLCNMLGYTESELIGKSFADVTHRGDLHLNRHLFQQLIKDGKPYELEKRFIRKDGRILWADVSAGAVRGVDGKTLSTVAVVVDVTARKQAETELQKSNEMLEQRVRERTHQLHVTNKKLQSEIERRKGLEGEILSVSDREQQRLGQELHDGLCQHLTAVAFMARSIALRLRDHRVIDAADIEKVAELVNEAAIDTRNLSRALHRVDVDAATLVVALQDLVDREIWRTPCQLEAKPSFRIDDDAAAAHLFRIAREAVINANKHAQAWQIVVRLERVRKEMVLRVIDDGIGLPKELKPQKGLGFHIMNYRAQLMGARLEIDSPQTGGTRVSCYFSVHAPRSNKTPNDDRPNGAIPKISAVPLAGDLTLRHLARQGAANG